MNALTGQGVEESEQMSLFLYWYHVMLSVENFADFK